MSLVGDRAAIAQALSSADGVRGFSHRPATPKTGDAYPLLGSLDRGPASSFETTWRVVVVLPGDERAASDWFDEHHEPIAEALQGFGYVERIEPGIVVTEAGDKEAMILTLRREA